MPAMSLDENDVDEKIRSRKLKNTVFSRLKTNEEESFDIPKSDKLKDPKKNVTSLSAANLFRFADKRDKVLMLVGTICGLALSATQALWLRTYMFIVNSYVDFGIAQANKTNNSDVPALSDFASRIAKKGVSEFIGIGILNVALVIVCSMSWSTAADRQVHRIRRALFKNIMTQEMGWFDATTPGDLLNRLIEDVQSIRSGIGEKVADSFILLSRAFGGIVMAFISGWKMTLVFLCFMPLIGGALSILLVVTKRFTVHEIEAFAKSSSIASEVLAGIRTVTAFGGQNKDIKRYELSLAKARRTGIRKGLYIGLCQFLIGVFLFSAFAVLIWYGPFLTRTEPYRYDAGSVMVVFFGVLGGTMSLGTVAPNLQYFMEAKAAAYKIFQIIDRKSQIDVTSAYGYRPHSIYGEINFNNVKFSYPSRESAQILKGLSITIPAGKTTALVGPSGCGKSTVIQLIQRFYDASDGQVTIDGRNVKDLNLAWLRSQIGIVNQEPVLFYGTVEENIRLGKLDATFEEVRRCATLANADEFIMKLPKGYNTLVGEQGTMLSGGQKQRIAIARAIISNPRILLLDEATSALDTESEKVVQRALDAAGKNRTTIAIAHRLSTIRNADVIYVIEKGTVLEKGRHEELMEKKGLYYDLVTAQSTEQRRERAPTIKFHDKKKYRVTSSKVILDSEEEFEDSSEEDENSFFDGETRKRSMSTMSVKFKFTNISKRIRQHMVEMLNDYKIILTIFQYNMKEWPYILAGIIFITVVAASMPVFVILFTELFEVFAADHKTQVKKSRELAIIVFFVGVANGISSFISSYSLERSGTELTNRMRIRSFAAMVYQDISWFDDESNRVGALLTRLSLDAAELKGMTGQRLSVIIQSLASVLIALVMCFVYSWKLTLVTLCLLPLIIFSGYIQGESLKKRTVQTSGRKKEGSTASLEEEGGKVASEALNSIRTVVSMRKEEVFIGKFNHYFDLQYKGRFLKNLKYAVGNGISQSLMFFMYAVAFGYGAHLVGAGELDFNLVFRVVGLIGTLGMGLGRGSAFLVDFADARESACNVIKLINRKPSIDARDESGGYIENLEGSIKFQNVHFSYPTRSFLTVLEDLSFTAPAGRSCAFVGQSGCGKSTTISLILRFYDADAGRVSLDNYDIRDLNIQWLRSIIGFVQQEPVLFNVSILENIKYGLPDNAQFDMADVIKVCQVANIHNDIMSLPMQYETNVGTRGSQLSGGQKQRIAIARALIRNPKILLLDEATSALDTTSEKIVQAALDEAQLGRTTISIAHRLSTIKDAHQICVVDKGHLVENGTHDALIKANGLYAKLAKAQDSGAK